jgi:predicted PilT family ATPase
MCFEMHGLEHEVRAAVAMVSELDIIKVHSSVCRRTRHGPYLSPQTFHHEIRFQIELSNEHREFISGKKNGKINKIMQTTNVKIKFETFNDHNFLIDISGSDASVLQGLSLLQEELPAEISFHVPETYHKRIIGVGGRSIQRIMKKYGVYVKFSNAEEFAALGGYNDNDDNVIARTPAKNAINLDNLKQSVLELVNPKVGSGC